MTGSYGFTNSINDMFRQQLWFNVINYLINWQINQQIFIKDKFKFMSLHSLADKQTI